MPLQQTLLECYTAAPPDQFACVGGGFQSSVRPQPEICSPERDALVACEVPSVFECITACRAFDVSPLEMPEAVDAPEPSIRADGTSELGPCPEPPLPCERLCWELDARFGRGVPERGMRAQSGSSADLAARAAPVISCAVERAQQCRVAPPPDGEPPLSWTRSFLECAGLPIDFDLFD